MLLFEDLHNSSIVEIITEPIQKVIDNLTKCQTTKMSKKKKKRPRYVCVSISEKFYFIKIHTRMSSLGISYRRARIIILP